MAGNLQDFGKQVTNLGAYFCAYVSNFSQKELKWQTSRFEMWK